MFVKTKKMVDTLNFCFLIIKIYARGLATVLLSKESRIYLAKERFELPTTKLCSPDRYRKWRIQILEQGFILYSISCSKHAAFMFNFKLKINGKFLISATVWSSPVNFIPSRETLVSKYQVYFHIPAARLLTVTIPHQRNQLQPIIKVSNVPKTSRRGKY